MIPFFKYQGTGNDFVMVDNRSSAWNEFLNNPALVQKACDRHFGIGADGLIAIENKEGYDFEMHYFNADGRPGSMCGNGGRCAVAFVRHLGLKRKHYLFWAVDGPHEAKCDADNYVSLKMKDVCSVTSNAIGFQVDTGSPHLIVLVENLDELDVNQEGRSIRYSPAYADEGINVNFVQVDKEGHATMATYERGVENETLSCGTGVTAASLVLGSQQKKVGDSGEMEISTKGGRLRVSFSTNPDGSFTDIWLSGPAEMVFEGTYAWD